MGPRYPSLVARVHNIFFYLCFIIVYFFLFLLRQIPDLPLSTAGPSKKPKLNKSGIDGRIMDPIARSAAQRAARNAASARFPSPAAEEEAPEEREASVVIVVPDNFIVTPQRPSTPRDVSEVRFFFL